MSRYKITYSKFASEINVNDQIAGRPNLCIHITPRTIRFMFLDAPLAVISYKSIFLCDRSTLCFYITARTIKFMPIHAPLAVFIYKSIFLCDRLNLCFYITEQTIEFMLLHDRPAHYARLRAPYRAPPRPFRAPRSAHAAPLRAAARRVLRGQELRAPRNSAAF